MGIFFITDFRESVRYFEFRPEKGVMMLFLPPRKCNMDQKKEILCTIFDNLHSQLPTVKHGYQHIALCLNEPQKHEWQWQTFLKQLLLSRDKYNVVIPLVILEPSKQIFSEASVVIQNYLSTIWNKQKLRIQIQVKSGELVKEKVGAIVNSANDDLTLNSGAVSKSILTAAGDDIQKECERIMRKRKIIRLSSRDVVVTKGYSLPCEFVLHGALAQWYQETLGDFVYNCLSEAEKYQLTSVAFPSLGTGNLKYPPDRVASIMFETVNRYAMSTNLGSLQNVIFVIYSQDTKSLQAFQDVQNIQEKARQCDVTLEKCPNPCFIRVTVAGASKDEVEQTFSVLQNNIKERRHKHVPDLQEPAEVFMNRGEAFEDNQETSAIGDDRMEINSLLETEPTCMPNQSETSKESNSIQNPQNENGNVSILIRILLPENQYDSLVKELGKHNIHANQVIWCPYTPQEARIKMPDDTCAQRLIEALKSDERYKPSICSLEAVVNIKARLSSQLADFLRERKGLYEQLKKQSGVDVVIDKDDSTTLTGCLSEISAARGILLRWKDESTIPMVFEDLTATKQTKEEEKISLKYPIQMKQELKDEELDDETVVVEPIAARTVVAEDNSLRIFVTNPSSNTQEEFPLLRGNNQLGEYFTDKLSLDKGNTRKQTNKDTFNRQNSNIAYGASGVQKFYTANDDSLMMTTKEGIEVFVYEGDMCNLNVDCIVNSSNEYMNHSYGLSAVISKAAGPHFTQECQRFIKKYSSLSGNNVCVTSSGNLKNYKNILHVCSPVWNKRASKDAFFKGLSEVIEKSLEEANKLGMKSIAIPAVGSGGRGGPSQLCFSTYPNGVILFSSKHGKASTLREVHFVDINAEVVNLMQVACLLNPKEQGTEVKHKLQKISESVKETFVSYIGEDDATANFMNIHLANKFNVTICNGPLFSAYKHRHMKADEIAEFENTAVVITEDTEFCGKSRSASHCLQRGGNDFCRWYEQLKMGKEKKKIGKACHSFGDHNLHYGGVIYAVMPSEHKKALNKKSTEQMHFFSILSECCRSVLKLAERWKIQHVCMPVLGEDFYSVTDSWFVEKCVVDMMQELREFAKKRKDQQPMLVHVGTRPTSVAYQAFVNETYEKVCNSIIC
ncbi:PARP10_14_15 [Mytilus coruscus]|uniref:PARP10_14_15 n=1 Tax=Mytilus coruscus TaxID=42192 RepID=A0A6J8ALT7_MYTCO|nr:PARP10_14_15 [Mytilus coruscus]